MMNRSDEDETDRRVRRPADRARDDRGVTVRSAPGCAACSLRAQRAKEKIQRDYERHQASRDSVVADVSLVLVGELAPLVRALSREGGRSVPAVLRAAMIAELQRIARGGDDAFSAATAALLKTKER